MTASATSTQSCTRRPTGMCVVLVRATTAEKRSPPRPGIGAHLPDAAGHVTRDRTVGITVSRSRKRDRSPTVRMSVLGFR